jgi:hypothetical protein
VRLVVVVSALVCTTFDVSRASGTERYRVSQNRSGVSAATDLLKVYDVIVRSGVWFPDLARTLQHCKA